MHRRFAILLIGVGLFISGCSLAPSYTPSTAPIPETWPQGQAYQHTSTMSETSTVPKLQWKEFFTDPALQQVIEMALNHNRDLRLAALNVETARALYGIQRAEFYPTVNAVGSGSKQRIPADLSSNGKVSKPEQYGVNLGIVAWEIDFLGRIRSLKDQALEAYLATEEARRGAQITLISEVARTYLTLAADRENLTLAQATLETQKTSFRLIKKSYDLGLASEIDLRRARTQVEAAHRDVPRFTQLTAQDQNALELLTGTQVPEKLLPQDLNQVAVPKDISAGLSSEVLLTRPDILAAEHRLKGAYAFIGAARAALFPRIALTGSMGTASADLSGLFKSGSGAWSVAPSITLPIFDARAWAALRVSKAERKILLTQYEKTIQSAFRDVADVLAVQGTINQQLSAQQALVDSVSATYTLSDKRYKMGIDSYLGVLDAQRSLYAQQQILISLRLARISNQVMLYAVLGGGV